MDDKPKLYILPASRAPQQWYPEETKRQLQKLKLYDANGTEFVNLEGCTVEADREVAADRIVTVRMRLRPGEYKSLEAPPPNRLRELAEKWREGSHAGSADREGIAIEVARETCADELDALIDQMEGRT